MRPFSVVAVALAFFVSFSLRTEVAAQQTPAPQTARQALIEMFFGDAPGHMEKHLPDVTRKAFEDLDGAGGKSYLSAFSLLAAEAKSAEEKIETYDTGSTLVSVTSLAHLTDEKVELTVEGDSLSGDEDQIELAIHVSRAGKEEPLPVIPRFIFTMKMEAEVWRLNEISVSVRLPLADPDFLKSLMERQRRQNEPMTIHSMRSVVAAETSYQSANNSYACALSTLGNVGKQAAGHRSYLYDSQLVSGKKNGYAFAISGCDGSHYQLVAEPAVAGLGMRAFCADESGTLRASSDGKGASCLSSGEVVEQPKITVPAVAEPAAGAASPSAGGGQGAGSTGLTGAVPRVRVSAGVASALIVSKVAPVYPPDARAARIQGTVVMRAIISPAGDVESVSLISGHPLLAPAALDAVKQWKYKPYLLNGKPVTVDTEVQVNFTLRSDPQGPIPQI